MFTRSAQCVHSTAACCSGVIPGAVPKCGLSTSGESPRHPLMHSVEPGVGMYGIRGANGFGMTSDVLSPSTRRRLAHVRHFESRSASTFESSHRSSNSQSQTWMVWVIMSGDDDDGALASM